MKKIISFLFILTPIISLLLNDIDIVDSTLLFGATLINIVLFNTKSFNNNFCKWIVLICIWVSVVLMPAYHLVYHILKLHDIVQVDYNRLVSFGARIYFFVTISWTIFSFFYKRKKNANVKYKPIQIPDGLILIFFIFLFCLSTFCYAIGLGRMGTEGVELPFHLSGIINLFRRAFVPLFVAILVENYVLRGKQMPRKFYVLFGLWTLFEVFAWMSKSILVSYFEPIAIVLYFYYKPTIKQLAKFVIPFAVGVLFLYPIIGAMRNVNSGSFSETFSEAKSVADDEADTDDVGPLMKPLNRTFMTAQQYAQDYSYLNQDELFDFSRTVPIILIRGAAAYQTFVIDGFPPNANHSSGTSGLMDPLLHGGYGLCYIFVFIFMLLATWTDRTLPQKQYSIYVILLLTIWELTSFRNISSLYDSTGIQTYLVRIIAIYIAYKINFKRHAYIK